MFTGRLKSEIPDALVTPTIIFALQSLIAAYIFSDSWVTALFWQMLSWSNLI
jgi:hypothetical protein